MNAEDKVNLVTVDSHFEGTVRFADYTRFEGKLTGTMIGTTGSEIVIGQHGVVDGRIECDAIIVDGYVRGEIVANSKIIVSGTGRVFGELKAPSVEIRVGAFFEGRCFMEALPART